MMFEYLVSLIDLVTFLSSLLALIFIIFNKKHPFKSSTRIILVVILLLILFHSFSNVLEWSGSTSFLDPYEDVVQVVEPLFWGFLFYSFLQAFKQQELEDSKNRLKNEKNISHLLIDLMTHDLINYNTVALVNLELLSEQLNSDSNFLESVATSLQAIQENTMLVDNVKILHQLFEKEGIIETKAISLLFICESAKKKIQNIYPSFPINLSLNSEDSEILVKGHAILENVFINLFTNSVRYRKDSQQSINVEIDIKQDEEFVIVTYSDHGIGIHDELKDRIFDRFLLSNSERKGSGLGLSIVKRIVEALDGKIWVKNRFDCPNDYSAGTTFVIQLVKA